MNDEEITKLRKAVSTMAQALREVKHAQTCGPQWYTKGDKGLYMQVSMWVNRGFDAVKRAEKIIKAEGYEASE